MKHKHSKTQKAHYHKIVLRLGSHWPGKVPGATRGAGRCAGVCSRDRSCGLHGVLLPDPEEPEGSVWHGHTGQPSELQLWEAPARETETTEKAKTDTRQNEESVQVVVEEVLLRGLEHTRCRLDLTLAFSSSAALPSRFRQDRRSVCLKCWIGSQLDCGCELNRLS